MIRDFLKINCYHLTSIRKDNSSAEDNQVHIASSCFPHCECNYLLQKCTFHLKFDWAHFLMTYTYILLKQDRGCLSCTELGQVISITFKLNFKIGLVPQLRLNF